MERLVAAGLVGLAMAMGVLVAACGASAPWGSVAETSAPPPRVGTPPPSTATPTSPATATPTSPTTPGPAVTPSVVATPTAATPVVSVPGGNVEDGREAIQKYGCGSCHVIPGVPGANGRVGPSLAGLANRKTIAGVVPNTPQNLIRWIQNPQAVKPGTTMPNLGVTETDARNIAAYLYSLADSETPTNPSTPSPATTPDSTPQTFSPMQLAIATQVILVTPGFPPVQENPDISQTLQAMVQYQHHLRNLTVGQPTGGDLVDMARVASGFAARVQQQIPQMSSTQQVQALQELRDLVSGMFDVVTTYIILSDESGPTVPLGTPEIVSGAPLTLINVQQPKSTMPFQVPSTAEILREKISKLRGQETALAAGQPTGGDVVVVLESIGSVNTTMRQLAAQLGTSNLEQLTGDLAGAMDDLVSVMEVYVRQ